MKNGFLLINDIGLPTDGILKKFKTDKRKNVEENRELTKNYRQGQSLGISGLKGWEKFDEVFKNKVFEAVEQYHKSCNEFIGGQVKDTGYRIHHYPPGKICEMHCDGGQHQLNVFLSCIFFLNTVKKGGELVFPQQDYEVKPKAGSVLLFPSSFAYPHYTKPTKEDRFVAVTWLAFEQFRIV